MRIKSNPEKKQWHWLFSIPVLLLVWFAFQGVSELEFTNWDDPTYVLENNLIRSTSAESINRMFTSFVSGNYHPLTILSLALDYARGGLDPKVYHQTNLFLHLGNTLLVFLIMMRIFQQAWLPALVISLAFGIHPLKVESVAWVAERKDVLYAFFWLAAWLSYIHYRQSGKVIYFILTHLLFVFSCLSKGMAVTLVPVLLITDYLIGRKWSWRWLKEKFFLFLLALGTGVLVIIAQDKASALGVPADHNRLDFFLVACHGILFYSWKAWVPLSLSTFYPYPVKIDGWLPPQFLLAPLGLILLFGGLFYIWNKHKSTHLAGGVLIFLLTVFPVLQWLPVGNAFAADRYFYLPSIGYFIPFASGLYLLTRKNKIAGKLALLLTSVWFIWCIHLTREQVKIWKNSITLFSQVAKLYPNTPEPYNNMGIAWGRAGDQRKAIENYQKVLSLSPGYGLTYNNLGNAYGVLGKYDSAYFYLEKAIQLKPSANAWSNMGNALGMLGQVEKSRQAYYKAIELDSSFHEPYHNLGASFAMEGEYQVALKWFEKAIQQLPDYADAWYSIGVTYEYLEDKVSAINAYSRAKEFGHTQASARIAKLQSP